MLAHRDLGGGRFVLGDEHGDFIDVEEVTQAERERDELRDELAELSVGNYPEPFDTADGMHMLLGTAADCFDTPEDAVRHLRGETSMPLPVDADGEPIHIGDVLESNVFGRIEVEGFVHDAVAFWSYDQQPARLATCPCDLTRHVKERTVEDVLREFTEQWDTTFNSEPEEELITEYAAEIRELMGGDER